MLLKDKSSDAADEEIVKRHSPLSRKNTLGPGNGQKKKPTLSMGQYQGMHADPGAGQVAKDRWSPSALHAEMRSIVAMAMIPTGMIAGMPARLPGFICTGLHYVLPVE